MEQNLTFSKRGKDSTENKNALTSLLFRQVRVDLHLGSFRQTSTNINFIGLNGTNQQFLQGFSYPQFLKHHIGLGLTQINIIQIQCPLKQ